MSRSIIYLAIGIAFGAVTNGCARVVLARMKSLGQEVGVWRWAHKDLVLYKDYWKIAKKTELVKGTRRDWNRQLRTCCFFPYIWRRGFSLNNKLHTAALINGETADLKF